MLRKITELLRPISPRTIRERIWLRAIRLKYERYYRNLENPLISVIIPTLNRADIICERGLASALCQTYQEREIIVVGDNCTDDTGKRLSKIKNNRLYFYNLLPREKEFPNKKAQWLCGPARPINKGRELCSGKWVAHIDDDDIWTKDHLEKLLRFAQKGNYEFVSSALEAERYGKKEKVGEQEYGGGCQTWLYRSYLKFFKADSKSYKKSWNQNWDIDLPLRMQAAGVRMGYLDEITAYIIPRPGEKTIGYDAIR